MCPAIKTQDNQTPSLDPDDHHEQLSFETQRFNSRTQGIINNYLHVSKSKKIFPKLSIDTISHQTGDKILSEIKQINKTGTKCDAGLIISFLTSCLTIFFQSKWSVITKILLWIGQLCSLHYLYDIYKCDLIFQLQPKFQVEAMFNCQFSRDNVKSSRKRQEQELSVMSCQNNDQLIRQNSRIGPIKFYLTLI